MIDFEKQLRKQIEEDRQHPYHRPNHMKIGDFIEITEPELFSYSNELEFRNKFYYSECADFDISIMQNNKIIEVTEDNVKYLNKYYYIFNMPNEEDLIKFLIKNDKFEEVIEIKEGKKYSELLNYEQRLEANNILQELHDALNNYNTDEHLD